VISLIRKILFSEKYDLIYFHTLYAENAHLDMLVLIFAYFLKNSVIITVDHDPLYLYKKSKLFKLIFNFFNLAVQEQIFIGKVTRESYIANGIKVIPNCSIESSFLPPDLADEQEIIAKYPQSVSEFIISHKPLIVANAYHFIRHKEGDLYGLDSIIELMVKVLKKYNNAGLIFSVSKIGDHELYERYHKKINDLRLNTKIFIFLGEKEFWPLLKTADLFLRPTRSDSFGISVAEALYFGVPAIASDVCQRPNGTILYRAGEKKDFFDKVISQLDQIQKTKNWKRNGSFGIEDGSKKILESGQLWH
jgi:glycosyltransferase involved in cell wall biosynthesis